MTPPAPHRRVVHSLQRAEDFERVMGIPALARSPHFALHHLAEAPLKVTSRHLSSSTAPSKGQPVDNLLDNPVDSSVDGPLETAAEAMDASGPTGCWLGLVVPKRHARRAVTRNLIKRQARAAAQRHAPALQAGLWLLRLKAGFDQRQFPSAASGPLKALARQELEQVFSQACRRLSAAGAA